MRSNGEGDGRTRSSLRAVIARATHDSGPWTGLPKYATLAGKQTSKEHHR